MRAIDLRLKDKLFVVVSIDVIRTVNIKTITTKIISDEEEKKYKFSTSHCVILETLSSGYGGESYISPFDSERLKSTRYSGVIFTTLEAAQRHQLRMRKRELKLKLEKFKASRKDYEEFKSKYKNLPASNPA